MTKSHGPIKCASCDKVVATISETGLSLPLPMTQVENCKVCDQVRPLYDAMNTADELYAQLSGRRDTYGPKQSAFADVKRTHRVFSNLLASVEKHTEMTGEDLPGKQAEPGNEVHSDQKKKEEGYSSTKRPRSQSSNSNVNPAAQTTGVFTKISALPQHKRLKFSESVEFREDYRPSDSYARSNEAYIRGRYAAPDGSELLDTSGSDKSFLKFTGMKKVGKNWVDIWEDDSIGDTPIVLHKSGGKEGAEDEGRVSGDPDHATQQQTSPESRVRTSTGRSSTADAVVPYEDESIKNGHNEAARTLPKHPINKHAPNQAGRVHTESFKQHDEKGDLEDLEPRRCQAGMGDDPSKFGVYDPAAGKQDSTQGAVEHALVLGRSPHSRHSSLDHISITADGHSPCTTHQATSKDPYNEHHVPSSQDKRPTANENTNQAPLDATTPFTSQTDLTKPRKDDR